MKNEIKGVLPQELNKHRKHQILMLRAVAPFKLEKHVMPTFVRDTKRSPNPMAGQPTGGVQSALVGPGGVCVKCGQTRDDILYTVEGKHCDAAAFRKFAAPFDLTGMESDGRTGPAKPANIGRPALSPVTATLLNMVSAINDPLADVFA